MKRHLPLLMALMTPLLAKPQLVLIDENFDAYSDGQMLVQSLGLPWSTWSGSMAEDITLSNEQAVSGMISARFNSTSANGGPGDIMLRLGNRTTGSYALSWNMYIPSGFGGYFNLQHNEMPGSGSWAVDVTFRADGSIEYSANVVPSLVQYPQDEWFNVTMGIDLGTNAAGLSINADPAASWMTNVQSNGAAGPNQLGGVNFYPYAGGDQTRYYVDDVLVIDLSNVGIADVALSHVGIYPNPTTDIVWVELADQSTAAIATLVDLTGRMVIDGRTFLQNGPMARTQLDLTGLPSGLYLVRVQDGSHEVVRRVTKM